MVAAFKHHTEFSCSIFQLGSLLDEPKPGSFVNHNIEHYVNPDNCGLANKLQLSKPYHSAVYNSTNIEEWKVYSVSSFCSGLHMWQLETTGYLKKEL